MYMQIYIYTHTFRVTYMLPTYLNTFKSMRTPPLSGDAHSPVESGKAPIQ